jgi:hypothetical protein
VAIVGLTDNRAASFPRIGILRKGDVKPTEGNKPGRDLDHFRFVADDQELVVEFHEQFGEKPRAIEVFLPFATADENLQAWREDWLRGGLVHRCNGETCVLSRKGEGYTTDAVKCPGGCKPVGRLTVWIPAFRRLAFITVLTTSKWDIITLTENLRAMELIRPDLRGIPFTIRRRPRDISVPGKEKGTRSRMTKWLLSIEPAQQWVGYQLAAMERAALPAGAAPLALPAPSGLPGLGDDEDDDSIGGDATVVEHRPTNGHARPNGAVNKVVNGQEPIRDHQDFWIRVKALRTPPLTNADVHQILRVKSVKDLIKEGATWTTVFEIVEEALIADAAASAPPDEDDYPELEEMDPTEREIAESAGQVIDTPSGKANPTTGELFDQFDRPPEAKPAKAVKAKPPTEWQRQSPAEKRETLKAVQAELRPRALAAGVNVPLILIDTNDLIALDNARDELKSLQSEVRKAEGKKELVGAAAK